MIEVLLVDDEAALLDVTKIFMEKDGSMKITAILSAKEALDLINTREFDVIVSDYEMPQMNGIDFLREVRASHPLIPFIIFTGRGREHVVIEALNSGADFYLQKGGDPKSQFAELIHKIRLAVERQRIERSLQITREAVEKASVRIFWLDSRGRFIYANEATCSALGYTHEELMRLTIGDIDPFFSRDEWNRFVERLRSHRSMVLQAFHTRKDRMKISVEMAFNIGEIDERGIIFAYSWNARERTALDVLAAQADARCHRIAEAFPHLYFEVEADGRLRFWNNAASAFTGQEYKDRTHMGGTFLDIVMKGQQAHVANTISRVGEGHQDEVIQVPLTGHGDMRRNVIFRARGFEGEHGGHFVQLLEIPPES